MKIKKIFNNNAVSTILANGQEVIMLGNGIGFNKRPNDQLDTTKIEKRFAIQTDFQVKFLNLIENVTPQILKASQEIVELSKNSGTTINDQGILSLIDHIQFALERYQQGIVLPNLMLSEIKMLYPQEFNLGQKALDIINSNCGSNLPIDEAGYIAMHFVNAGSNNQDTYNILKFINGMLSLLKQHYAIDMKDDNHDFLRLTLHLKLLAQRIILKNDTPDLKMEEMYDYLISKDNRHHAFLIAFRNYVTNTFNYEISRQEEVYILVHITRII